MTNVLIVEDERLAGQMLRHYVESAPDRYSFLDTLKVAADTELYCLRQKVDLILMDVCTAGQSSGLDAAAKIKSQFPSIKIIIITSAPEYRFLEKARKAGCESFWYKEVSEEELLDVMDRTMAGQSIYPDDTPPVPFGKTTSDALTPRELETLYWLIKEGSSKLIAQRMGISVDGVNKHIKSLKAKSGCEKTSDLILWAHSSKLVLPEY